jgi:hypothetical protein
MSQAGTRRDRSKSSDDDDGIPSPENSAQSLQNSSAKKIISRKMSQSLFESLRNSSSPQELISSIQEVIKKNDPSLRVKEIIPIILGKKQLVLESKNKDQQQQMIQSVGELFLWIMPYTPNLPDDERKIEEEIRAAAKAFCAIQEVEAFFLEVMLPNAFEEQAIYVSARSVCRLTNRANEKRFTSFAATKQLLEMAARTPTQFALRWTFQAVEYVTYNANEDSVRQGYATEENAKLLLQAFQRVEDGECLENASLMLFNISYSKSDFSRICTQEFASAALDKLSTTKSTLVVEHLCGFIANAALRHPECCSLFCTEEATKIFLRASELVNEDDSAHRFSQMVGIVTCNLQAEPTNFATKEFCAAVVKCFDFATTDESRGSCAGAIAGLAKFSAFRIIFVSIPNIVEKLHDAIKKMEDLHKASNLFIAVQNICIGEDCTRPFATLETLRLLVDSRKKVTDAKALFSIDFAMNSIVLGFPEVLDFCAAQSDVTSEYQQRLLKEVRTLEQLASFLENDSGDFFELHGNPIVKRRSLLIVFEKLDHFILSREENNNSNSEEEFQKFLSQICQKLYSSVNRLWFEILNHQFLDSVVCSILQNAKGVTCLDATFLILWQIQQEHPPALSSSLIKVILEKLDEEDEENCFSKNANGNSFFSIGIQFLLHAVSKDFKDLSKTFFIDNSQLVKRVFEKGRVFGDSEIEWEIDLIIREIEEFSPQTKGKF